MDLDSSNTLTEQQQLQVDLQAEEAKFAEATLNESITSVGDAFASGVKMGHTTSLENVFGEYFGLHNTYQTGSMGTISGKKANTDYGKYGVTFDENTEYNAAQISYLIDLHADRAEMTGEFIQSVSQEGPVHSLSAVGGLLVGVFANPSVWLTGGIFNALKIGQLTAKGTGYVAKLARVGSAAAITKTVPGGGKFVESATNFSNQVRKAYDKSLGRVFAPTGPALSYGLANAAELKAVEKLENKIGLNSNLTPYIAMGFFLPGVFAAYGRAKAAKEAATQVAKLVDLPTPNMTDVLYEKIPGLQTDIAELQRRLAGIGSNFGVDDVLTWAKDPKQLQVVLESMFERVSVKNVDDLSKFLDGLDDAARANVRQGLLDVQADILDMVFRSTNKPPTPVTRAIKGVDNISGQPLKSADNLVSESIDKTRRLTKFDLDNAITSLTPKQQKALFADTEILLPGGRSRNPAVPLRMADDLTLPIKPLPGGRTRNPASPLRMKDDLTEHIKPSQYNPRAGQEPKHPLSMKDDLTEVVEHVDVTRIKPRTPERIGDTIPQIKWREGLDAEAEMRRRLGLDLLPTHKLPDDLKHIRRPVTPDVDAPILRPGDGGDGFYETGLHVSVMKALDEADDMFVYYNKMSDVYDKFVREEAARIVKSMVKDPAVPTPAAKTTIKPKTEIDSLKDKKFRDMDAAEQLSATKKLSDNMTDAITEFVNCMKGA